MYVDLRLAKAQAEYKREQLSRSYGRRHDRRSDEKPTGRIGGGPAWYEAWARLSLINR